MSLLRDIQEAITNPSFRLADILRKAKVLAFRLDHQEFKYWVNRELNGYESNDNMPEYRILREVESYGYFVGVAGNQADHIPIPSLSLPKEYRELMRTIYILQGVESIESLVQQSGNNLTLSIPWTPDNVAVLQPKVLTHMECISAWRKVGVISYVAVLDTVKNRILDFVLEIESKFPNAGDIQYGDKPIPKQDIQQIFNSFILHSSITSENAPINISSQLESIMIENRTNNFQARDINGVINLGTISGNVTNSINQLRESNTSNSEQLADLLLQLKSCIESEHELNPEDKEEALEQVNALAEAGQNPQDGAMKKAAKTAFRVLKGIKDELPPTVALIEGLNQLIPAVEKFFSFFHHT
ncbi:MAG: hypothetical protein ACK5HK_15755 [Pseudanabaena sp.]|jgi:hypothetical protein